ncbi:MAG: NADH-quinone oxidoreductase subunit N, partial [Planctomycetaceae bacterium]
LLLYGLSFIYGAVGSTNLWAVQSVLGAGPAATLADGSLPLALVLVVGGLSFKMAAVPFHFYAPDVYQGTTSPLAGLLAWAPKAAGVIAVLRIVSVAANYEGSPSPWLMALVAAATMFTGNILALLQDNLKRLFAYSSVAQAGYMLIGVGVVCVERTGVRSEEFRITSGYLTNDGSESVLFYLLAYAVMTLGVFAVLTCLSGRGRSAESVHDLAGLGKRHPGVALAMVVFLFSLTGIPLTAGFWGKLALFSSALASGDRLYTYLAVIGVINAVISSYYYLRIIGIMYMHEPSVGEPLQIQQGGAALSVVTACAALTLMIGVLPSPFLASIGDGQSQVSQAVLAIVGGAVAFGALVLLLTLGRERRLT